MLYVSRDISLDERGGAVLLTFVGSKRLAELYFGICGPEHFSRVIIYDGDFPLVEKST